MPGEGEARTPGALGGDVSDEVRFELAVVNPARGCYGAGRAAIDRHGPYRPIQLIGQDISVGDSSYFLVTLSLTPSSLTASHNRPHAITARSGVTDANVPVSKRGQK